ncbi:tRNA (adenosine(37)-N6)-dimethylallyltransferase MiaA [Chryseosolibacter indicus]|uniref:tRNA dimethylallyltransferase n=1 Tax=Chryseosolibacter indicus TaxID=2782351 RepID=A0ABS5VW82_9BACT|nr:tRNA (adenosine(37)-N6)-dimethylallyltransferase MiaA [Chryseosolibacter indicus]MBT1705491.1 tRNA (adenosine(37)-N6)-dimethylallyltransferase MiaA [Chryseosolibacter indicus]
MKDNKHLIVVAGPTAVGKTAVAIQLARQFNTEIISADSRQIFREMSIGTAKPSASELKAIRHYFIDSHSITADYDAARFGEDVLKLLEELFRERNRVILCGGSGLYIKAVCEGFDDIPEVPGSVRDELTENYKNHGISWLQAKLEELDPEYYALIDKQNPHRIIRALEVFLATGKSIRSFQQKKTLQHNFNIVKIGLELPREELYRRIDERMDIMIENGLFEEAKALYNFKEKNALQTVGYQEVFEYLDNNYDYAEAVRLLKRNSRRYAKRQLTWFKRDNAIEWFNPNDVDTIIRFVENKTSSDSFN